MKISGRTAIVTGGCQGIGRGIAYALLQKHAKVFKLVIVKSVFQTCPNMTNTETLVLQISETGMNFVFMRSSFAKRVQKVHGQDPFKLKS